MENITMMKRWATTAVCTIIAAFVIVSPVVANGCTDPVMVKDVNPGRGASAPGWLAVLGSILFFQAYGETDGDELWKSDDTPAGKGLDAY